MQEFLLGLACLICALVFMAVVGHGLWKLMAAIARWLTGETDDVVVGLPCSTCGASRGIIRGRCVHCGFHPELAPHARSKAELAIVANVLRRWSAEGLIDADQSAFLQQVLEHQQAILDGVAGTTAGSEVVADSMLASSTALPASCQLNSPEEPEVIYLAEISDDAPLGSPLAPSSGVASTSTPHTRDEMHPLDREYPPDAEPTPTSTFSHRARRRATDMLQSFMEAKNIRWGEIVAGLLIVGSAIGCVVSLQETLRRADPYVPAFLFLCAIAAIYGAGMYTLRQWNLQSISRAILIIALLLVPLNFLAATTSAEKRAVTDPIFLAAATVGLAVSGAIVASASRTLVPHATWRLTAAVMGAAFSQIYLSRLAPSASGLIAINALVLLPAGS